MAIGRSTPPPLQSIGTAMLMQNDLFEEAEATDAIEEVAVRRHCLSLCLAAFAIDMPIHASGAATGRSWTEVSRCSVAID